MPGGYHVDRQTRTNVMICPAELPYLHARGAEHIRAGQVRDVVRDLKEALGCGTPRMHNTLRDALPVKLRKLLCQVIVLLHSA